MFKPRTVFLSQKHEPHMSLGSCRCHMLIIAIAAMFMQITFPRSALARKYALVIGNNIYLHNGSLSSPNKDADDMQRALKKAGYDVLSVKDAKLATMEASLRKFANNLAKTPDNERSISRSVFYFSGHGIQKDGRNYLVPSDADIQSEDEISSKTLPLDRIRETIATAKYAANIFILDACRNNPFRPWAKDLSKGLAVVNSEPGEFIAYATQPGWVAADGGPGKNSPYTESLLRHIEKPGISIESLIKVVMRETWNNSAKKGGKQHPWIASSLLTDFSFFDCPENTQYVLDKCEPVLDSAKSKFRRAHAFLSTKDYNKAIAELKAIAIDFADTEWGSVALFQIGIIQSLQNRCGESRDTFLEYVRIRKRTKLDAEHAIDNLAFIAIDELARMQRATRNCAELRVTMEKAMKTMPLRLAPGCGTPADFLAELLSFKGCSLHGISGVISLEEWRLHIGGKLGAELGIGGAENP